MKHTILIVSFLGFFLPAMLHAQSRSSSNNMGGTIYFEETFFPKYVNNNDTSSITASPGVATETGLGFDTRTTLGYIFFDGTLLSGLSYNNYSLTTKRSNVAGGSPGLKETTNKNQFGPTLGWLNGGFRILLTYFTSGEKSVAKRNFDATGTTADGTITNKGLSGYQLTMGYTFAMWGMEIGPSLIYTSTTYTKQSNKDKVTPGNSYSNVKLFSKAVDNEVQPMLSIVVRF